MSDDTSKTGAPDRTRINIHEEHELRYWTGRFNCSPEALRAAVNAVGVMVKDVEAHLAGTR